MKFSKRVWLFGGAIFLVLLLQGFFTEDGFTLGLLIYAGGFGLLILLLSAIVENYLTERDKWQE